MFYRSTLVRTIAPLTLLLAVGCESGATAPETPEIQPQATRVSDPALTAAERALAQKVVAASARYHSVEQAEAAGYEEAHECVAAPGIGGMGYHFVNGGLVDPVFDPLQPEVLLYAPGPGGKLRLVAVEYIVIDVGQPAPTFGTQAFDVGGTPVPAPHWSLHAWFWQTNPEGTFARFNPTVSCD